MNKSTDSSLVPLLKLPPPIRSKVKTSGAVAAQWLLALALIGILHWAKSLLIPMVVASMFALLLSPLVTFLKRFRVPRSVSALVLVTALVLPFTLLGVELAVPAQKWARLLPELDAQFTQKIDTLSDAIQGESAITTPTPQAKSEFSFFNIFRKEKPAEQVKELPAKDKNVVTERIKQGSIEVVISLLSATPAIIAQLLTGLLLIVFLLIFAPQLFAVFITGFHKVKDKNRAITLVVNIQNELSHYIITVSIINAGLAFVTAVTLQLMGVEDALLWGVVVGLLNFAPYLGSFIGVVILILVGLTQYGLVLSALLPTLAYLAINLIESQFVTPTVLGHRMRLNPLVLIIWLLIWGWLWGAVGVLLAVPLLVCMKLVAGHLGILTAWLKIIEAHEEQAHR